MDLKHFQSFTTFAERSRAITEETKLHEKTTAQKEYADFFLKTLQEFDVTSPAELDDTKKKEFFEKIAKGWKEGSGITSAGEKMVGESEAQEKYQAFFKDMLAKYNVKSPSELSDEEKSKFFAQIKTGKLDESYTPAERLYVDGLKLDVKESLMVEKDVTSDEDFKEYATELLKAKHKDNFNQEEADKTISGLLKDKNDKSYGELVGMLQNS